MDKIDFITPLNGLIAGFSALVLVVATFYVNQWMALQKRKHAEGKIEAAITEGVAMVTLDEMVPQRRIEKAAAFVATVAPKEMELLKMNAPVIEEKIKARVSASRGIVF